MGSERKFNKAMINLYAFLFKDAYRFIFFLERSVEMI